MYQAFSQFLQQVQFQRTLQLHPWHAHPEPFSTPHGVFSLEQGLAVGAKELIPAPSLMFPSAKHPLHLGGVKQWLKEDLLNSSRLWLGLEPSTSA